MLSHVTWALVEVLGIGLAGRLKYIVGQIEVYNQQETNSRQM